MYKSILNIKSGLCLLLATLLLAFSAEAYAQKRITGKVVDETGMPVIGANVLISGSNTGVSTDNSGVFSLSAKKGETITISYLGYNTAWITIGDGNSYTVALEPEINVVEEVIVIGYGSARSTDLTGSVASVSGRNVEGFKSSSVMEALGGQVSGVQITQQDGTPGSGFDIKIRGIGTVTGDASPLFVVDGFQVDNIDYLSNADIASIEILKDASSSAIYGARAANGVVMVTTKSGKTGRAVVTYNGSASYRRISKELDLLNPYEFVALQMEINPSKYATTYFKEGIDSGTGEPYRYQTMNDYMGVGGVNWQGETFKPTWSQDHNISVSGGSTDTKYVVSYSNFSENGIFTNSSFQKNTAKVRLTQKIVKGVNLDATINYARTDKKGTGTSADGGRFNALAQILSARPTGGLKMTDQELLAAAIDPLEIEMEGSSLAQVNPIVQAQSVTNNKGTDKWTANVALTVDILPNLQFKTAGSYNMTNSRTDIFYRNGSKEAYRNGQMPYGQSQMNKDLRWTNYNYLTYKFKKERHSFDAMLAQETNSTRIEWILTQSKDFPTDMMGNNNLGLGATPSRSASSLSKKLLLSYFTRVNYNFSDRYLFTATLRMDGSSVFSDNNKWGYFPSFSGAWRISEEQFMKQQKAVSNLKLRVGWGMVGNDAISSYLSLPLYNASKYGIGQNTITTFDPKHIPNTGIKWEGSSTINVGVDAGFFKNRLNVTVDAFVKNTKDLLLAKSFAYITGFESQYQNVGKIQNKGLEISISSTNIAHKDFVWTTNFNISFIRNKLKQLQAGENVMYTRTSFDSNFTNYDYIAMVGSSLGLMYGYEFDGVYQESDFTINAGTGEYVLKPGITDISQHAGKPVQPGFVKYKDMDGNEKITDADRTVIGNGTPDWYGGITNSFTYKDIDFSFMFQFNYGNDVYNATRLYGTQSDLERTNKYSEVADRWTPTNASNSVPSAKGYVRNDVYSRFVEDGSFLRLKSVTLGYTLPKKLTQKFYVSKLRIYTSAQNLFTISNYKGYDPEVSMRSSNPMTPSFDWGAYPRSRVFTFGLDVQF